MTVAKNLLKDIRDDGMQISGVNGTFTANTVKTSGCHGIVLQASATANTLTKNVVSGAADISYRLFGSLNTLTKNKAFKVGTAALEDNSPNGNTLDKNNF